MRRTLITPACAVVASVIALSIVLGPIQTVTAQEDEVNDRATRIEEYKTRVTDRITDAEQQRISAVCTAAQTKIARLQSSLQEIIIKRRSVYADISQKLETIVEKLEAASIDTSELQEAIVEMQQMVEAFIAAVEDYETTLSDLATMDCEADPTGFKAALAVAREKRSTAVQLARELREYIAGTIKSILQTIRQQITNGVSDNESTDTETDTSTQGGQQ